MMKFTYLLHGPPAVASGPTNQPRLNPNAIQPVFPSVMLIFRAQSQPQLYFGPEEGESHASTLVTGRE
jgi:hypothetical protein